MKRILALACLICIYTLMAWSQVAPSLKGTVTDPSGAYVPGALVQLLGPAGEQRTKADNLGRYSFPNLRPGKYTMRVIAKGFSVDQKDAIDVSAPMVLDSQLVIEAEAQVVNVEEEANRVSTDPSSNGTSLVLGQKELAALSDDPDELEQELQAMAGPGAGPNGGQIYIDGFSGGNMPPKSSIREVRINSNPYSAEYDRPGFGRIEILTKPGTDKIHAMLFGQYNKEALNGRSPLLTQSTRPPYQQRFFGVNLTGPIKKDKASFSFNMERRTIDENAFILATTLDSNLNPVSVNQAIVTPQTRINLSPRLDYTLNSTNTLVVRYQYSGNELDKQGIGAFNLASRAYNSSSTSNTVQVTETNILSAKAVNETRFQYQRTNLAYTGDTGVPALIVQSAFANGGAQVGDSGSTINSLELTNSTTYTQGTHVFRFGARIRQSWDSSTSEGNFGGTYSFFGGSGPELDAANQPIPGTSIDITALERYRRTLLFQQLGYSTAAIRAAGGGASQLSLSAGIPITSINQFDIGLFLNDDWRIRPNFTLSYGLRYETQTNISDYSNWAPRVAFAWGLGGTTTKPAKTVLRVGAGIFYDRLADTIELNALRYNGVTQQSFLILNPDTFPTIPSAAALTASKQPQQLQLVYGGIHAPRNYQLSVGLDRQVNKYFRFGTQYIESRGVHLQRALNINAPLNGIYPFGDQELRQLTESVGFSRSHMLIFSPSINYKKFFLFGFYGLSYGRDDISTAPANPYNLRAEYGPSGFADVRNRATIGTNIPLPWNFSLSPFLIASSGQPYNITTGHDTNLDGNTADRPALVPGASASSCNTGNLVYANGFGCFNLLPAPGTQTIGRNIGRGPGVVMLMLRASRTWSFGNRGETARGPGGAGGGVVMKGPPPPPGGGGGGPMMVMMGGPGGGSGPAKKYSLTIGVNAQNVLNHPNFSSPNGDLSSPYFGQSLSLAGGFGGPSSTYNRKIDLNMRFAF